MIDAGFLDLARLGELPQSLPLISDSLKVVDATIGASTPSGTGYHRYNGDGYGDADGTGQPWATTDTGTGHPWPVLSGERAEHDLAVGDPTGATGAAGQLGFMLNSASGVGLIPEQVWEQPDLPASPYGSDPTTASIGFTDGLPAGSAAPLTWATAGGPAGPGSGRRPSAGAAVHRRGPVRDAHAGAGATDADRAGPRNGQRGGRRGDHAAGHGDRIVGDGDRDGRTRRAGRHRRFRYSGTGRDGRDDLADRGPVRGVLRDGDGTRR